MVFGKSDVHSPFPQVQFHVTVAHLRVFFQQQSHCPGNQRRGHGGAAFFGVAGRVVGTACDGCAGGDDIWLADARPGGSPARIIDHPASHDADLLVVIGASYGDDLAADSRRGDGAALGSHVPGGDDDHQAIIPGFIDSPDQSGIFAHVPAGKRANGNVDNADMIPFSVLPNPAQAGQHIGGISIAFSVQHFHRNQAAARGNALKMPVGSTSAASNDAADVGAMSVVIVGKRLPPGNVAKCRNSIFQIFMEETSGIQNGNSHILPAKSEGFCSMNLSLTLIHMEIPVAFFVSLLLGYSQPFCTFTVVGKNWQG